MPYKSLIKKREYQRDWVRQKRSKGSTTCPNEAILGNGSPEQHDSYSYGVVSIDADGNPVYEGG